MYLDSGATNHIIVDSSLQHIDYNGKNKLFIVNGLDIDIVGMGHIVIPYAFGYTILLHDVVIVPTIAKCLLSLSHLVKDNNIIVEFHSNWYLIKEKQLGLVLLRGILEGGLYKFETPIFSALCQLLSPKSCGQ